MAWLQSRMDLSDRPAAGKPWLQACRRADGIGHADRDDRELLHRLRRLRPGDGRGRGAGLGPALDLPFRHLGAGAAPAGGPLGARAGLRRPRRAARHRGRARAQVPGLLSGAGDGGLRHRGLGPARAEGGQAGGGAARRQPRHLQGLRLVDEARHHARGRGGADASAARRVRRSTPSSSASVPSVGHDRDEWPRRTEAIVPAMRRALGDGVALLADANSCYSAPPGDRGRAAARGARASRISRSRVPTGSSRQTKAVADALGARR